jgi:phenylpyruvate tautomerase PptA (4-oxalocrotonate tautomerase family)
MPLVRVSLREGKPPSYRTAIGDGIHRAMVATINIPPTDRFQLFHEHDAGGFVYDPTYLNISRGDDLVIIQITLNQGRTLEQKRALYAAIADNLGRDPGVRREDVMVNLVEVPKEDWSFGNGVVSYPY